MNSAKILQQPLQLQAHDSGTEEAGEGVQNGNRRRAPNSPENDCWLPEPLKRQLQAYENEMKRLKSELENLKQGRNVEFLFMMAIFQERYEELAEDLDREYIPGRRQLNADLERRRRVALDEFEEKEYLIRKDMMKGLRAQMKQIEVKRSEKIDQALRGRRRTLREKKPWSVADNIQKTEEVLEPIDFLLSEDEIVHDMAMLDRIYNVLGETKENPPPGPSKSSGPSSTKSVFGARGKRLQYSSPLPRRQR
jgi:hypothetical protein